jgi:Protein required for attachment to host cells.
MNSTHSHPFVTWIVIADNQLSTILSAATDDFSDIQPVLEIPFPDHPEHPDCKLTHAADAPLTEEGDFSHQSLTTQFARLIADELEQGLVDHEFQRVILIATTQLLELMHNRMSSELSRLVDQRLDLEMMKEPLHVIAARLQTGVYRKRSLEN